MVDVRDDDLALEDAPRGARRGALQRWLGSASARAAVLAAASLLIAFGIWQLLSTFVFNPFLIPPPLVVIETAIPMVQSGEIFADVSISLVRVLVGFVTGSAAAIVLGVLLGRIRLLNDLLDPIIELLRYPSPTAMIPIAVIWFGIGEMSKYFLIFWGTFFIVLINTAAGVCARADRPPARRRMPGRQPAADFRAGGDPVGGAVHRDRHARRHGLLVHEHHPGRDPGGGFRHRLPVAAVLDAAADQPHLRRAADDLRASASSPTGLSASLVDRVSRPLHVVRVGHLRRAADQRAADRA